MMLESPASPALHLAVLGWKGVDYTLLLLLPVLLCLSGFFSGSETALFGMSETERLSLQRRSGLVARAVASLQAQPRMLLITILLGNMAVNVLYFVISSVLMMRAEAGVSLDALLALASLLIIVLFGEVAPKMLANTDRLRFASITAPLLLPIHRALGPVRLLLDTLVVTPLSRLTAPTESPPALDADELAALIEMSQTQGVIDTEEQRLLHDVLSLSRLKVRDVMTPRVRVQAIPVHATRDDIVRIVSHTRLTQLPVYEGDVDRIVGILHVKRYLGRQSHDADALRQCMTKPLFVPSMASLDQLLDHFRRTRTRSAIAVDEYGGTDGLVAIQDVVEELVGHIAGPDDYDVQPTQLIGLNRWLIDARISVRDWAEAFGQPIRTARATTLGGLLMEHLGRMPHRGDVVDLGNVRVRVHETDDVRVLSAIVTLVAEDEALTDETEQTPASDAEASS